MTSYKLFSHSEPLRTILGEISGLFNRITRFNIKRDMAAILLRYNSLPCGTECFTGCREELRPTSKKKRHLYLAVASGCRHVICPFVSTFLVGSRHFTVFGKYLLPFSSYISVQFYCYMSLFMYFIYYCIKHILANFQHFRFCNLSLF